MRVSASSMGQMPTVECGFQLPSQKLSGVLLNEKQRMNVNGNIAKQRSLCHSPLSPIERSLMVIFCVRSVGNIVSNIPSCTFPNNGTWRVPLRLQLLQQFLRHLENFLIFVNSRLS